MRVTKREPKSDGPVRAALYARVSTDAQLDNTSPDAQLERERAYCRQKGYQIVAEQVEAMSGSFVLARSKYNKYLDMGADGLLNVIVADIPDRLGRGDAIAKLELLAQMNNLRVEYASPGRDASTIDGYIQKSAEQMVSGIEKLNIRRRMMEGRRDWAKHGRVIASGLHVYGYRFDRQFDERGRKVRVELVVYDAEAGIVKVIFEWCAVDGLSTYEIAKRLTERKIPTPKGKGTNWRRSSVVHILKNETYAGVWHYAKNDIHRMDNIGGIRRVTEKRSKSEWIAVTVPAIVDSDLFRSAQTQLAKRRGRGFKPTKNQYLLRGRVRCARCHSLLHGYQHSNQSGKYLYYRCRRNFPDFYEDRCHTRQLRADRADDLVWEKIKSILKDKKLLYEGIETRRAEADQAKRVIQASIAGLLAEKQKGQTRIDRWYELYGDGGMTKDKFYELKRKAEAEVAQKDGELAELSAKLAEYQVMTPEQQHEIEQYRARIIKGFDGATFEDKCKYMEWLKIECIFDDESDQLTIAGYLGQHVLNTTSRYSGQLPTIPFRVTVPIGAARAVSTYAGALAAA